MLKQHGDDSCQDTVWTDKEDMVIVDISYFKTTTAMA